MASTPKSAPSHQFATLAPGQSVTVSKVLIGSSAKRAGALEARMLTDGTVRFYWRMTRNGKSDRIPIGLFDPQSPPAARAPSSRGYSVKAAEDAAHALALADEAAEEVGGLRAQRQAEQEAKAAAARAAAEAAAAAARAAEEQRLAAELASKYTMGALVLDYAQHLQEQGKHHAQVRSLHRNWIAPDPMAALPANEVTAEQVADLLRRITEAGHLRTRERVRSALLTAYKTAMQAPVHDGIPLRFKDYRVKSNPAEAVPILTATNADKNPLSLAELRTYWQALQGVPGLKGCMLRLHVLLGGQRVAQLCAARVADLSDSALVLRDTKGRRKIGQKIERPIVLPLVGRIFDELNDRDALPLVGPWLFSSDLGKTHVDATSLANWAREVVGDLIPGFSLKRIRSAVETVLAQAGVPKEHRARLQSHGQGGVQDRHYNAHDYLPEVSEALAILHSLLDGAEVTRGQVLPMRRRA